MSKSRIREELRERRVVHRPQVMEKDPDHNRVENLGKALAALREALGEEWATDSPSILCGYARDQSFTPASYPHVVCMPASTEDVGAVYRVANEYLIDVMPFGTGLTTAGMALPTYGGIICDLRRMDKIVELDGENMFAIIEPGVNYLVLQVAAQKAGCRVLNPSTSATAGVISNHAFCNINTMASKYGFGMDNIIDVEMVLPNGDILKTGPNSYGAVKGHVPGPGPDLSTMFRYAFGTLGIVTRMTIRLYPEARFHQQVFPSYEEDRLEVMAEALEMVAQDNLCLELAHMMDSFFGIFLGETNKEAAKVTELMPRHNLVTIFGGETQEEADLKSELTEKMLEEHFPDFSFLPIEAMEDLTEEYDYVNFDTWVKYFNVTVRVQRVRGSFMIGALIDKLENMVGIEKTMREACTNQVGTTDDALAPDDASTYLQPYHMGRSAYMEYDMYTNQCDKDDLIRILMGYGRATITAMAQGMIIAAGAGALIKGMPMMDLAMPAAQPNMVQFMETFTRMKMALDPNNISNRRWEYDTGTMKKVLF
ncbi:MAG: FAD-binding oxidoreductase [Actinobacteria bacterium]|nr:FAD-binding oxidoreductase [Actinomycetota bacterium]MBU4219890.1 FAD-binding oxidoreductase [Actinomycetota bacterium]MBU4359780.1 FAD-binding oxidoreductase [Actinomycetota bacterium]MBU4392365.1 FAD-binding oxidoreductase [Actinomycetota bacterium]MBU4402903.1 FAD-binding oxidoreductase [Actinomycetota bacterium]